MSSLEDGFAERAEQCGVSNDVDSSATEESDTGVAVSGDGQDGVENAPIVTEAAPGVPDPPFDPDSTLVVSTYGQNDNGMFGEESPLLSTTAADGC